MATRTSREDKKEAFVPVRHPGRLTAAAKRSGLSLVEQARHWQSSGDTSEKRAANLYLNVFRKHKWHHIEGRTARRAARKGARTRARRYGRR